MGLIFVPSTKTYLLPPVLEGNLLVEPYVALVHQKCNLLPEECAGVFHQNTTLISQTHRQRRFTSLHHTTTGSLPFHRTNIMPPVKQYRAVLVSFMAHRDGEDYEAEQEFTPEHLGTIKPREIVAYFNKKAYGMVNPGDGDNPRKARSSSLYFWKKAISYFMPNKHMQWNELANVGNPTKSILVNEMIKKVKTKEVRQQGAPPQARRPLTTTEFQQIIAR